VYLNIVDMLLLKVSSYGGQLSFELQYTVLATDGAQSYNSADVELLVSNTSLALIISICFSSTAMMTKGGVTTTIPPPFDSHLIAIRLRYDNSIRRLRYDWDALLRLK